MLVCLSEIDDDHFLCFFFRFCGSYSAIAGGFEAWGLKVLTGNHVFTFRCGWPAVSGCGVYHTCRKIDDRRFDCVRSAGFSGHGCTQIPSKIFAQRVFSLNTAGKNSVSRAEVQLFANTALQLWNEFVYFCYVLVEQLSIDAVGLARNAAPGIPASYHTAFQHCMCHSTVSELFFIAGASSRRDRARRGSGGGTSFCLSRPRVTCETLQAWGPTRSTAGAYNYA